MTSHAEASLESKHADLLNKLGDMIGSLNYAARRPVLKEAEQLIYSQEQQLTSLTAELAAARERITQLESRLAASENREKRMREALQIIYERLYCQCPGNCSRCLAKAALEEQADGN